MESSTHRNWPAALPDDGGSSSRTRRRALRLPARVAVAVVRGVLTFVFATVGAILGAITGALIGLATESGPVRGAGVGAISGAVVSLEVVESSMAIWRSHESGIWSVLYVLDVIWSLLTGRLVREKVDPAVQSAVESQMNAANSPFREVLAPMLADTFVDTSAAAATITGMPATDIEALPATRFTEDNCDVSEERVGCAVCLQDLEAGETVRSLTGAATRSTCRASTFGCGGKRPARYVGARSRSLNRRVIRHTCARHRLPCRPAWHDITDIVFPIP